MAKAVEINGSIKTYSALPKSWGNVAEKESEINSLTKKTDVVKYEFR